MGSSLGQAHWPPPQAGATSGRWPTVPGVTHLIARAQMGPIRTPGGPPNPRGRVPHQRCSRALVTPPPPRWPLPPSFHPQGRCPAPLAVPPGYRHVPSAPAACPCSGVLVSLVVRFVFFFVFFFPPPPMSSRCLLSVLTLFAGGRRRRGRGGGHSRCPPFCASTSEARRRHEARHLSLRWGGGCRVAPVVTLPFLRLHPRRSPRGGLHGACSPWARSSRPSASRPCRGVPGGGVRRTLSSSLLPPRLLPVALASILGGCGRRGRGGGGSLPFLRRKHVAGTVLARHTALVLLLGCGARHVALVFALPTLRAPPRCPPRWRGGAAARPSLPATPTLGGAVAWGEGGLSFSFRCPRVAGTRRGPRPSAGGGGVCLAAPFVAPSILRPHPRWSPRRGLHGARPLRARSCGSSRTLLPLPPHPAALPSAGGGALSAPPLPAFALGGAVVLGGGEGRPFRLPSVARTSQACCRHNTTTGRGTWLLRGGGFPVGFPALLHDIGPALQDHQPLLSPRR